MPYWNYLVIIGACYNRLLADQIGERFGGIFEIPKIAACAGYSAYISVAQLRFPNEIPRCIQQVFFPPRFTLVLATYILFSLLSIICSNSTVL